MKYVINSHQRAALMNFIIIGRAWLLRKSE